MLRLKSEYKKLAEHYKIPPFHLLTQEQLENVDEIEKEQFLEEI